MKWWMTWCHHLSILFVKTQWDLRVLTMTRWCEVNILITLYRKGNIFMYTIQVGKACSYIKPILLIFFEICIIFYVYKFQIVQCRLSVMSDYEKWATSIWVLYIYTNDNLQTILYLRFSPSHYFLETVYSKMHYRFSFHCDKGFNCLLMTHIQQSAIKADPLCSLNFRLH